MAPLHSVQRPFQPRLGVLSGTFNPPTRAHLALAEEAVRQLALDEVAFVIPEIPPHKVQLAASLEARAEMLLLAIGTRPQFSAAITARGLFLDIHQAIAPHYPADTKAFFLTGRDAAERILLHWPYENLERALAEMFARFDFAVSARGGKSEAASEHFEAPRTAPAAHFAAQIHCIELPAALAPISATLVRERRARGEAIEELVPEEVAAYIRKHDLYRTR